ACAAPTATPVRFARKVFRLSARHAADAAHHVLHRLAKSDSPALKPGGQPISHEESSSPRDWRCAKRPPDSAACMAGGNVRRCSGSNRSCARLLQGAMRVAGSLRAAPEALLTLHWQQL